MMAEGSLECSKPSACPSSCTATRNTSLPRRRSTPSSRKKAGENSGAVRKENNPPVFTQSHCCVTAESKMEPTALHVMMRHRSKPLMLPNMRLLCQKLELPFFFFLAPPQHSDRCTTQDQTCHCRPLFCYIQKQQQKKKIQFSCQKLRNSHVVAIARHRLLPNRSLFPMVHGSVASKWVSPPMPGPGK